MARLGERQPGNQPAGLGEPPPAADISRDRRAWGHRGHWTRGTRGDPAELPRPLAVGYGGITSGDFLAAGQTQTDKTQEQNKNFQKRKQNEVKGRRLLLGLVFCHGAHTREEQEHADEDINSNNNI